LNSRKYSRKKSNHIITQTSQKCDFAEFSLLICKWQRGGWNFFLLLYEKKSSNFFPVELEIINLAMEKGLVEKKEQFFGIF
jgi:hypothetical protein